MTFLCARCKASFRIIGPEETDRVDGKLWCEDCWHAANDKARRQTLLGRQAR